MAKARFRRETEAELYSDLGPPKLDRFSTSIIHLFLGPLFLFMIGFVVHETKEQFSHWKAMMDRRLPLFYINAA